MGTRGGRANYMAWQATLGGMAEAGARLKQRCPSCETWDDVDVIELLCFYGPDFTLIDYHPPCGICGQPLKFHASPGRGTPFRPLFK